MEFKLGIILVLYLIHNCACFTDFRNVESMDFSKPSSYVSPHIDAAVCDRQLSLFSEAFSRREMWALRRKYLVDIQINFGVTYFCSIFSV